MEAGCAIDTTDSGGRTPLHRHVGSRQCRRNIVELLVTSGADVNATDKGKRTALHLIVARNPRDALAELLRKHGARDTDLPDATK